MPFLADVQRMKQIWPGCSKLVASDQLRVTGVLGICADQVQEARTAIPMVRNTLKLTELRGAAEMGVFDDRCFLLMQCCCLPSVNSSWFLHLFLPSSLWAFPSFLVRSGKYAADLSRFMLTC